MLLGNKSAMIQRYAKKRNSAKLVKLLNSRQLDIRLQAINALGAIGDGNAVNAMIRLLSDPDPAIRREVIASMGDMGNQTIKSHLQELSKYETDASVKLKISEALAKIPQKF